MPESAIVSARPTPRSAKPIRRRLLVVLAIVAMVAAGMPHAGAARGDMHTYSGTIFDNNGNPLSGIIVSVYCDSSGCDRGQGEPPANPLRPRMLNGDFLAEDVTDASGTWSVTVAEPSWGAPVIIAWDPAGDHAPSQLQVDGTWATTAGIAATLVTGGSLSGRILADGNAPPAGDYSVVFGIGQYTVAFDSVFSSSGWSLPLAVGDDGRYSTPALPDGDVWLGLPTELPAPYVSAACQSGAPELGTISNGQDATADLELPEYATVSGKVTDSSGTGLADIRISFVGTPFGVSAQDFSAFTSENGSWSLPRCPGGPHWVEFRSADGQYATEYFDDRISGDLADEIVLDWGEHRTGVDAQLSLAGSVSVSVSDALGFAVPGASVYLCQPGSFDAESLRGCLWLRTASSGLAEFSAVPGGTFDVIATWNWNERFYKPSVVLPEGGHAHAVVLVTAGGRISGTVTDARGDPVWGLPVTFSGGSSAVTNAQGSYVSQLLRAGDYRVSFGGLQTRDSVAVVDANMTSFINAQVDVGYITGTVTSGGAPVADVEVTARPSGRFGSGISVSTEADGTYHLPVAVGDYTVGYTVDFSSAWHVDHRHADPVSVGTGGVDADLVAIPPPVAPPEGTDVAGASSARGGIPSFRSAGAVTVTQQGCAGGDAWMRVRDVDSGRSSYHGMSEEPAGTGTYVATVASAGELRAVGRAQVTISIRCADMSEEVEFSIYIDPSGVVQDQHGKPIEGATVMLLRENPDTVAVGYELVADGSALMDPTVNSTNPDVTGADGQFRWDVVAGLWKVRAVAPGCHAPGDSATAHVVTGDLVVPPPRLGLVLELECTGTSQTALVVANEGSLSDIGTAASLVAAGLGDAVVFAESAMSLGAAAAEVVSQQQPESVLLVGGAAALAQAVADEISALAAGVEIDRLSGTDRIHTAALGAQRVLAASTSPSVVIANGWSLSDVGTAASAVAAGRADAVLYAQAGSLGQSTRDVLDQHRPTQVLLVGGARALSADVASAAQAAAGGTPPERLGGATRVETAAGSASHAFSQGATTAVIANGWSLPDVGIAASLAAGLDGAAVLYTERRELGDTAAQLLTAHRPTHIVLVNTIERADRALRTRIAQLAPQATVTYITAATASTQLALHPTS